MSVADLENTGVAAGPILAKQMFTVHCPVQLREMQFLRYLDGFGKIPAQSKEIPLFLVCSEVPEDEHKPRAYPAIINVHSSVLYKLKKNFPPESCR